MIRARGLAPASPKDPLKAFLLVLSNAENRVILQIQALESSVACDQEFDSGDHAGMCDEVEETSDVLLKEYEVVRGIVVLKYLPNMAKERQNVREGGQLRVHNLQKAIDGRNDCLAEWGASCLRVGHNWGCLAPVSRMFWKDVCGRKSPIPV